MKIVKSKTDQTAFDFLLEKYGSIDYIQDLLKDNPGLQLDQPLQPGQEIKVNTPANDFLKVIASKKLGFSTATPIPQISGIVSEDNETILSEDNQEIIPEN